MFTQTAPTSRGARAGSLTNPTAAPRSLHIAAPRARPGLQRLAGSERLRSTYLRSAASERSVRRADGAFSSAAFRHLERAQVMTPTLGSGHRSAPRLAMRRRAPYRRSYVV